MLKHSTGGEATGIGQNQGERGQKRKLYSLEQPVPKDERQNFIGMRENSEGATKLSAMMEYGGGAVVSEASNSDSGSIRGSATTGSDEDVGIV